MKILHTTKRTVALLISIIMLISITPAFATDTPPVSLTDAETTENIENTEDTEDTGDAEDTEDTKDTEDTEDTEDTDIPEVPAEVTLAENIAAGFTEPEYWEIVDLAAYGAEVSADEDAVLAMVDAAVAEDATLTDIEKTIITLSALGTDASSLTDSEGNTVDLIEIIAQTSLDDIGYVSEAIYALLAYDSGNYTVLSGNTREALIDKILDMRGDDGLYSYEWGGVSYTDYDSGAMALCALAPYTDDREVADAVDSILSDFSDTQGDNGSWGSANTDAMVICALCALGIDIDTDTRFIKNECTALDGLMSNANESLTAFCYAGIDNELATEQGFRALAAYLGAADSADNKFSVYTFADFAKEMIDVTFELIGDTPHGSKLHTGKYPVWIDRHSQTILSGTTAIQLFCDTLDAAGYTYIGANEGYISSVTDTNGTKLSELDNGRYSGWLYTINDKEPNIGMEACILENGDAVRVYYTDDYRTTYNPNKAPGIGNIGVGGSTGGGGGSYTPTITTPTPETTVQDEKTEPQPVKPSISFSDVDDTHWAISYITELAADNIINGYTDGTYQPDRPLLRAELCAILARCQGADVSGLVSEFEDVDPDEWYSPYIKWATDNGIVNGVGDNQFDPEAQVSRQDLCVMIMRYAEKFGIELAVKNEVSFVDADQISDYATEAVLTLAGCGILNGDESGRFMPLASATRAETAKIIASAIR